MTPDLIVSWPCNCDYPLWRKWIAAERGWFGRVFVVFTDHAGEDISPFVRQRMTADITFLDSHADGRDWRDAAINLALDCSGSEWIWFTEQDLTILRPGTFWGWVNAAALRWQVIGWHELGQERLHPSCLFTTRAAIERTTRYFGTPPVDHFHTFTRDLVDTGATIWDMTERLEQGRDFDHMAGLSQNHHLIDSDGDEEGIYKRDAFRAYLSDCLRAGMVLEPGWEARARREIGE